MKKNLRTIFLSLSLVLAAMAHWSCEGDGYGDSSFSKSFITDFVYPDTLEIFCHEMESDTISVALRLKGSYYVSNPASKRLEDWDKERREQLFDSLIAQYGDTTYNEYIHIEGNEALANPIDSISIVSDADYDENHIAGTDLSDLAVFCGYVYGSYVSHGYPNDQRYREYYDDLDFYIKKPLSKFRPEDYYLWRDWTFSLKFSKPTLSQKHHITFTFVTGGKTFKVTEELDFSK